MAFDLVIRGGTLVSAGDTGQADLGIKDGRIACVGQGLAGDETIEADGLLVLPGAVDPHVHFEMDTGTTSSSDDFRSGTIAAACGGTTSVIDFVEPLPEQTMLEGLADRRAIADSKVVIDYGLHMTLDRTDEKYLAQIPQAIKAGVTSFKVYTTYGFRLTDEQMLAGFAAVGAAGGLPITHCENHDIIVRKQKELLDAGRSGPEAHPLSKPAASEGEAVERVLALAEVVGAPMYIVHISTERGAAAVARARSRGLRAFGETCPHYLLLTDDGYSLPDFEGAKYVCSPPIRKAGDNAALWLALAQDEVQTVGTDHCPFFFKGQKELGRERFTEIPGGVPGIEERFPLLYTFGVGMGRLDLNRWVEVCSTNPARLFGLYPRKGSLLPGADADIVLFDPHKKVTLSTDILHENVDYTLYEGFELQGYPVMTIVNGSVLISDGQVVGENRGEFLVCGLPQI